jgi:CDP-paratose 2-epimerase
MDIVVVTGSTGLIGSEAVTFFSEKGFSVVGVDNDLRAYFFGDGASTRQNLARLQAQCPRYVHHEVDIRHWGALENIFSTYGTDVKLVIHTAAQPSHDWAAREPVTDFSVNATGTLNLLEMTRRHCPEAAFIFTSTNKVYGDTPNRLPLVEQETRWEVDPSHPYAARGIDEMMSIDQTKHSLFGASKVAADVLVQEYGRYFGMKTGVFRGGCLTGPQHSGAELHGFLSYLINCVVTGKEYKLFGYKGKQVRDNIHAYDLVTMFWHFYQDPRPGEVYNAGGSRFSNCSVLEALALAERITGVKATWTYMETNRIGDHIWWISDVAKFREHYPRWEYTHDLEAIVTQIAEGVDRACTASQAGAVT